MNSLKFLKTPTSPAPVAWADERVEAQVADAGEAKLGEKTDGKIESVEPLLARTWCEFLETHESARVVGSPVVAALERPDAAQLPTLPEHRLD